jgi:hypothetical protein
MWIQLFWINPRLCLPNIASNSPTRQFNWSASISVPSDLLFLFQATAISICIIKRGLLIAFCCYVFLLCFLSLIPFFPLISFSLLTPQANKWSFRFRLHFLIQNTHQNSLHRTALRGKLPGIFHRQYTLIFSFDRWHLQVEGQQRVSVTAPNIRLADETKQTPSLWHLTYTAGQSTKDNPPFLQVFHRPKTKKLPINLIATIS